MRREEATPTAFSTFKARVIVLGTYLAVCFGLELLDWFLGGSLDQYGVTPRSIDGLYGILLGPFLHADFTHLISNSVPFAVLGWFVLLDGFGRFFAVYLLTSIISGAGIWLIGDAGSVHIGLSGVIFGFLGYLLLGAVFRKNLKSIILSLAAGILYGGYLFGILPGKVGISWEGHLFGLLGGVLAAKLFSSARSDET